MTFREIQFPEAISHGATGGPSWRTTIAETGSGYQYTNKGWSAPLHIYDISHAARVDALFGPLRAFFMIVGGMADGFRFKDWADFNCPDDAGTGVFVMLTSTTFQMHKRYSYGGATYDRKITKPVAGSIVVTGGSGASVATTTGVVTVSSGTPTSWVGQFDVPCRFGDDAMKAQSLVGGNSGRRVTGWSGISIVEIRL